MWIGPPCLTGTRSCVFYTAQGRIAQIAERLIKAGRRAGEPVALISNATCPDQDVRISTLAEAAATVAGIPSSVATLILIGPTVALRPLLADWQQTESMTVEPGTPRVRAKG